MSPQRFADVKGAFRLEKGRGQEERGCIPENYGRGKRTRAIYVEHSRAARFCCSLITRERNGRKGLGANWKRNYHDTANMLPNAMSLYGNVSSNVKFVGHSYFIRAKCSKTRSYNSSLISQINHISFSLITNRKLI